MRSALLLELGGAFAGQEGDMKVGTSALLLLTGPSVEITLSLPQFPCL